MLITGAAGGLGQSVVARWLAAGSGVVALDADREALERLQAEQGRDRVHVCALDLTVSRQVEEAFTATELGPSPRVVHLVGGFRMGPLAEMSDEDWRFLVGVNLETTFQVLRQSARLLTAARGGSVVAVSSPAARVGLAQMAAYGAVKAAVLRLVEGLARELAPLGGRANAVLPGTMDTAANRAAMPDADPRGWVATEAVAEVIHFLSSDAAAAVNGAAIEIPGPTLG